MRRFCPIPFAIMATAVVFSVVATFTTSRVLIELLDGVAIAFSVAVAVTYRATAWRAFFHPHPDVYDLLIGGIFLSFTSNALDRSWRLTARVFGQQWMMESNFIAFLLALLSFAAALHLMIRGHSPSKTAQPVQGEAWGLVAATALIGIVLGAAAVALDDHNCLLDLSRCR